MPPPLPDEHKRPHSATWKTYNLFGLTLASDFPFVSQLSPADTSPDIIFTCVDEPPLLVGWEQQSPAYASLRRTSAGESITLVYRLDDCDVLRFTHVTDFYLWQDRITCHLLDLAYDYMVEIRLLGPVLSYWLEREGIPALHASAIVTGDRAIAFLSSNKGGKSALAAALMSAGYPLLTDDILPVENIQGNFTGRPGYPQMRMWPEEAQHFLGGFEDLELIHPAYSKRRIPVGPGGFGCFCDASQQLAYIYLPERQDVREKQPEVKITPISPRDAAIELIRHSFAARIVDALGQQASRLGFFTRLARSVSIHRLVYPSGFEHLPNVCQTILEDSRGI